MSEEKNKKQPKFDKRKEPETSGGDGLEEQVTPDANFTKNKQNEDEETSDKKNKEKNKTE